jgi:hypothetical protein
MLLSSLYPSVWSTCSCLSLHSLGVCKHASVIVWALIRTLVASLPHCASEPPCASSGHATIATCASHVHSCSELKYALVLPKPDLTPIIVVMLYTSSAQLPIVQLQDHQFAAWCILYSHHAALSTELLFLSQHATNSDVSIYPPPPHRQPIER